VTSNASPSSPPETAAARPSQPAQPAAAHRWWILAVVGLAQLMVVLDGTIVNIALPSAQRDLGFSNGNRQWVVTAYALAFGSLLLLGGRLADLFGRKLVFLVGVAGFAGASAVAGASTGFGMLISARALQGAFGALLAPAALALLNTTFAAGRDRARAFGVYGAIAGTGGAVGLLLGGLLTEHLSWRWTLYVNLVFAVLAFTGGLLLLRNSRREGARLDIPGTLLVSSGLFSLVYGLSNADTHGWSSPMTWGWLVAGGALLALFGLWQTRAAHPLLPLQIILDRDRGASLAAVIVAASGMFGVFLFLTYYLQLTLHYSPVVTGLAFLPMIGGLMVSAQLATNVTVPRLGAKVTVPTGMALACGAMIRLTGIGVADTYTSRVLPALILLGLGLGHVMPTAMNQGTARVAPGEVGAASASVNTMQQIGGSTGTALLNSLATSAAAAYLVGRRPTPANLAHAQLHSYTTAFWWSAGIYALGMVVTALLYHRTAGRHTDNDEATPEAVAVPAL
jgi:EmrB/QacA subfamily drug resistance transporter